MTGAPGVAFVGIALHNHGKAIGCFFFVDKGEWLTMPWDDVYFDGILSVGQQISFLPLYLSDVMIAKNAVLLGKMVFEFFSFDAIIHIQEGVDGMGFVAHLDERAVEGFFLAALI